MDTAAVLLGILIGLALGAFAGWLIGAGRVSRQLQQQTVELSARAERAESLEAELRRQLEQDRLEGAQLRADLATAQQARASAEVRTEEALKQAAEQKQLVDQSRQQLLESFQALSNEALTKNNQAFLNLARISFETLQAKAEGELSQRQQAIDGLVKPLHESLQRYDEQMRLLEQSRQSAYGGLDQHLKSLAESHQRLQQETGNLVKALRAPTVRGQWGEITLKRVADGTITATVPRDRLFRAQTPQAFRADVLRAAYAKADILALHHTLVSRAAVEAAHRRRIAVFAWTVNDPEVARRFDGFGVDGIVTDDPTGIRAALRE